MATAAAISLEQYLGQTWKPDREFVDGELVERNVGEHDHSTLQSELIQLLGAYSNVLQIRVKSEYRVRMGNSVVRIPDLCVLKFPYQYERVLTEPPLICIEIVSPEDRLSRVQHKILEYLAWGVPQVWVIDPEERTAFVHTATSVREMPDLVITSETPAMTIDLRPIFAELDELKSSKPE